MKCQIAKAVCPRRIVSVVDSAIRTVHYRRNVARTQCSKIQHLNNHAQTGWCVHKTLNVAVLSCGMWQSGDTPRLSLSDA